MESIYYLFIPLLILLGIIQSALMPSFRVGGHSPDLILVLVVAWSLLRGTRHGVLLALLGGIVLDVLSAAPFGIFTVALVCASLMSSFGTAGFFRSPVLLSLFAIATSSLAYYGISLGLLAVTGHTILWLDTLLRTVLPALALNAVGMLLLFPLTRFLHVQTVEQEMGW